MKHTKCYVKDYPRPQFVRDNWLNLNGKWKFQFDDENVGEEQRWFEQFPEDHLIINVPFSYQTKLSGINDQTPHDIIWYERTAQYDLDKLETQRLLLNFEGSDYVTKVWVNGEFIGLHQGAYNRFTFDITQAVKKDPEGKAKIVVRAEDTYLASQPRGKQKWLKEPFGCWYQETNGLWKSVWSEYVSPVFLESVKMTPNHKDYYVEFEYTLNEFRPNLTLVTEISYDGVPISRTSVDLFRQIGSYKVDITNDLIGFKVHWWDDKNPNLYDIEFKLVDSNQHTLDYVGSYLGFRAFFTHNDIMVLNQNPVYLRMVLEQGYFRDSGLTIPSEDDIIKELQLIKDLGFNGLRLHQKIEDQRFLYYADIMGLMVWVEMPSAYEYRDRTVDTVTTEWMKVVKQFYNHPSVICWVPMNESWGVPRIVHDTKEQSFTKALYFLTKAYDPIRPVIANDGWEHTYTDIVTLHNYTQNDFELSRFYDNMDEVLENKNLVDYTQWRLSFAEGHGYKGQPIVISEFAGIGYKYTDEGWGYGNQVTTSKEFVERLTSLIAAIRKNNRISGFCITQITDVESEINGLLDYDRQPKAELSELKKAITQY